jgi:hypothetical protein
VIPREHPEGGACDPEDDPCDACAAEYARPDEEREGGFDADLYWHVPGDGDDDG